MKFQQNYVKSISVVTDIPDITCSQAPVPLTIFRSNSKLYKNLECSNQKHAEPITTKFLHRSRQLYCRDVCKISSWLVGDMLNQSDANFGRISNSIEISLVGRTPGLHQLPGEDNNIWYQIPTWHSKCRDIFGLKLWSLMDLAKDSSLNLKVSTMSVYMLSPLRGSTA